MSGSLVLGGLGTGGNGTLALAGLGVQVLVIPELEPDTIVVRFPDSTVVVLKLGPEQAIVYAKFNTVRVKDNTSTVCRASDQTTVMRTTDSTTVMRETAQTTVRRSIKYVQ